MNSEEPSKRPNGDQLGDSTQASSDEHDAAGAESSTSREESSSATVPDGSIQAVPSSQTVKYVSGSDDSVSRIAVRPPDPDFGRYKLIEELGRGGMGVVFKARDCQLNRLVAIKVVAEGKLATAGRQQRFLAETESAARLDHPGIVPLYDVGTHDGVPYFSMAYVDGYSLALRQSEKVLSPREAAHLVQVISNALQYAHEQGVIHRDLKPGNIMMTADGQPRITDFGLAKQLDRDDALTATGEVMGTPSFMSPEQARGESHLVGPPADVYALGAILMWLVTGRPPFQAASLVETLRQVVEAEPVPLRQLNPDVHPDLQTICSKCLEKSPDKRYSTARELEEDLERFLNGEPISARPVSRVERGLRWAKRKPLAAALVIAVVVMVALLTGLGWVKRQADAAIADATVKSLEADTARLRTTAAEQQAAHERQLANQARGIALLSEVRQDIANQSLGWTWRALERLKNSRALADIPRDNLEFNSLKATVLSQPDFREQASVAPGFTPECLTFGPDGLLYLGERLDTIQPTILAVDPESGAIRGRYGVSTIAATLATALAGKPKHDGFRAIAVDGEWVVAGTRTGRIHCWRIGRPASKEAKPIAPALSWQAYEDDVADLCFSPDGSVVASISVEAHVKVWQLDLAKAELQSEEPIHEVKHVGHIDMSSDGQWLAMRHGSFLEIYQLQTWTRLWSWPRDSPRGRPTFSPNGRQLAVIAGPAIDLLDFDSGQVGKTIAPPADVDESHSVYETRFSADGTLIAVVGNEGDVRVYEVASGRQVAMIQEPDRGAAWVAFSKNNRWLAVACMNRTRLFAIRQPAIAKTMALAGVPVQGFDVDSGKVATTLSKTILTQSSSDGGRTETQPAKLRTLRLTDLEAGQTRREFHAVCLDNPDVGQAASCVSLDMKRGHVASSAWLAGPIVFPLNHKDDVQRVGAMPGTAKPIAWVPAVSADSNQHAPIPANLDFRAAPAWGGFLTLGPSPADESGGLHFGAQLGERRTIRELDKRLFRTNDECLLQVEQFGEGHVVPGSYLYLNGLLEADQERANRATAIPFGFLGERESNWQPRKLQFDPTGKYVWGICGTKRVVAWSLPEFCIHSVWQDVAGERDKIGDIYALDVGEAGVFVGVRNGSVYQLSLSSETGISERRVTSGLNSAVHELSASADRIAIGLDSGQVLVTDHDGTKPAMWDNPSSGRIASLALSPDGTQLVIGTANTFTVAELEDSSLTPLVVMPMSGAVVGLKFVPGHDQLITLTRHELAVRVWDLRELLSSSQ